MQTKIITKFISLSIFSILTISGCKPSYPRAKVFDSIVRLCKEEYNTEVKVKIEGKTLGVYMAVDNLLASALQPSEESFERLGNVLQVLSRITLSTDADLEFITLVAKDSKITGFELILTRYVEDIKRFMVGDISRGEYVKRMLWETRVDPKLLLLDLTSKEKEKEYPGDEFSIEEVSLPSFLAKQISRRIEDKFKEDKHLKRTFRVTNVEGEFITNIPNSEKGVFEFTLDIVKEKEIAPGLSEWTDRTSSDIFSLVWRGTQDALKNLKEKRRKRLEKEDILPISLQTAKGVLQKYNFRDFGEINIKDINTGESLVVNNKNVRWP